MLRAQLFGTFSNALKVFSSVAAEGGCLHCVAFDKAVRQTAVGSFEGAVSLVETTKKLPEVWGADDDEDWMHYGQIFLETPEGRIRFVSSLCTEVVLAAAEDGEFRVTVVGKASSVRRRIKTAKVRWHLDTVDTYEFRTPEHRFQDFQRFCRQELVRRLPELQQQERLGIKDAMLVLVGCQPSGCAHPLARGAEDGLSDSFFETIEKVVKGELPESGYLVEQAIRQAGDPEYDQPSA